LESIGLDEATITQLLQQPENDQPDDIRRGSALALEYEIHGKNLLS
jgi:hypothetical protein